MRRIRLFLVLLFVLSSATIADARCGTSYYCGLYCGSNYGCYPADDQLMTCFRMTGGCASGRTSCCEIEPWF